MCGILCCLSYQTPIINFKKRLDTLRPRGPDDMVITCVNPSFLAGHTRLAISMPLEGSQPIQTDDWVHIHNGEFYDHSPPRPQDDLGGDGDGLVQEHRRWHWI